MYHTLTKEEIYTTLDERHSPETQKLLSAGNVAIAGLLALMLLMRLHGLVSVIFT